MARGSKECTERQKRQAEHIEEGYEERGGQWARGRAARLGDRQQDDRRRQKIRLGSRQAHEQGAGAQRRPAGRRRFRRAPARGAIGGEKSGARAGEAEKLTQSGQRGRATSRFARRRTIVSRTRTARERARGSRTLPSGPTLPPVSHEGP